MPDNPIAPAVEDTLLIAPPPLAFIRGRHALQAMNAEVRLPSNTRFHSASDSVSGVPELPEADIVMQDIQPAVVLHRDLCS